MSQAEVVEQTYRTTLALVAGSIVGGLSRRSLRGDPVTPEETERIAVRSVEAAHDILKRCGVRQPADWLPR